MESQISSIITPKALKPVYPNLISKVRVVVRVRPFLPQEIAEKNGSPVSCVSVLDQECDTSDEVAVYLKDQFTSRNECYKLDSFFGREDNNVSEIFYNEVSPLIPGIFNGYNATVFAYGATGSGKTYTMQGNDELPGLMPRSMSTILSMSQTKGSTVEISYYEVYMDRCYDLLELKVKEIAVLDDKEGQIHLRGLSQVPVNSMYEFYQAFSCGVQRRKVAHTGLNDVSSRSHGVLVIAVSTPCGDGSGNVVTGKLNLIDLAGNEDNRRTCNEGIRLQESAKINQSLFALSNVIYALNNNKPRVPYRESKLTRILQDSLGGTSRALMVACLNPGEYQESVHTVSLAARSRHISNFISSAKKQETPNVKVDMEAKLLAWLESKGKTKNAKTPSSFSNVKKASLFHGSAKAKGTTTNQGAGNAKERTISVAFRNLFHNGEAIDSCLGSLHLTNAENKEEEEIKAGAEGPLVESETNLPGELLDKDEKMTTKKSTSYVGSSPVSEKKKWIQNSPRKALSPIHLSVNQTSLGESSFPDQQCPALFEPKTPKTPFIGTSGIKEFQKIGTPVDNYNAWSSHLKSSLIQEYLDFLNTARREELLELKGIGLKRAEYILEVRETSPLKSLSDLEKIGLSSKQVHNLFSKAARGIFDDGVNDETPSCCSVQRICSSNDSF